MKPLLRQVLLIMLGVLIPGAGICQDAVKNKAQPDKIVASDYPSINDAVDAARELGVYHIYIPSGTYTIKKTLNLTSGPNGRPKAFSIEGAGPTTILIADTGDTPAIDLSGSSRISLSNFLMQTPLNEKNEWQQGANVGILMARVASTTGGASSSGHHDLRNVIIQGNYSIAAAYSYCSEENTYDHCAFINEGGDAFILTGMNKHGVTSPYHPLGFSSNVVANFYFPWFWSGKEGSVGLRLSYVSDVNLFGGFFAAIGKAFAAIYMDGTGQCESINLINVRTEGDSGHTIYAVGAVHNILIQGGSWHATNAENIHYQDRVPNNEGPHRFVTKPNGAAKAANWVIRQVRLNRSFQAEPTLKYDASAPVPEGFTSLRFESLQDSSISNIAYYTRRQKRGEEHWSGQLVTDTPVVVVEKYSRRNTFEVPSKEAVDLRGDARGNTIIGLAEGLDDKVPALWMVGQSDEIPYMQKYYDAGTRRTHIGADGPGSLMNFGLQNVYKITDPQKGDFAIHDGTGFKDGKARLAVYDGKDWLFFNPDTHPARLPK